MAFPGKFTDSIISKQRAERKFRKMRLISFKFSKTMDVEKKNGET